LAWTLAFVAGGALKSLDKLASFGKIHVFVPPAAGASGSRICGFDHTVLCVNCQQFFGKALCGEIGS
jgi:hypothetical protein